MSIVSKRTLLIALLAFFAALAGVFVGRVLLGECRPAGNDLHELLHERLDLDTRQHARLEEIEGRFAVRRRAIELELRADNARLAEAIQAEHGNGPKVRAAVDKSHGAMGELQKETLAHIFEMRQLLRPDQAAKFDSAVTRALTSDGR